MADTDPWLSQSPTSSPHDSSSDPDDFDISDPDDPTAKTLAVLLSQSGFSPSSMLHASKSGAPLMLVHLEGGHPHEAEADVHERGLSPENDAGGRAAQQYDGLVRGVWCNPALIGRTGLLRGLLELRRDLVPGLSGVDAVTGETRAAARYGFWYGGRRL
jgi:hypothetical protein